MGRKGISDRRLPVDVDSLRPEEDHRTEDERLARTSETSQSQTQRYFFGFV